MPRKQSEKTHGEKLLELFGDLYFARNRRSMIELTRKLGCSKQTVARLVDHISRAYVPIEAIKEGRQCYYQIKRPEGVSRSLGITTSELTMLYMCQAFTRHLLGTELIRESEKAIEKSCTLATGGGGADHFAAFLPGTIDYTPRQNDIRQLVKAMDVKKVCEITYRKPWEETGKTFFIKPYKLISYNNALYLHAAMSRYPGSRKTEFEFDPLLAVHRLEKVSMTDKKFVFPVNYDFEKQFNQAFGIIKGDTFKVRLELTGYAASYAGERRFSPDQQIKKNKDCHCILTFTASSRPEVLAWVLSFGEEVKVLSPKWLVEEVKKAIKAMGDRYE